MSSYITELSRERDVVKQRIKTYAELLHRKDGGTGAKYREYLSAMKASYRIQIKAQRQVYHELTELIKKAI